MGNRIPLGPRDLCMRGRNCLRYARTPFGLGIVPGLVVASDPAPTRLRPQDSLGGSTSLPGRKEVGRFAPDSRGHVLMSSDLPTAED